MNKKIFIKNRPFDINDANDIQNWTEDALKKTMASIYSSGVVQGLNVVQNSGMQVTLNIGTAFDSNYDFINVSSAQTLTIANASSNPRYDKVVISYKSNTVDNVDTLNTYGMGTSFIFSKNKLDSFQVQVIQGTPASSPVVPATPANTIALAQILIPANAVSIINSNITDLRAFITISNNIVRPQIIWSSTPPTDITVQWVDTVNNIIKIYKGGSWVALNANNANTLNGKAASDFASSTHTHTDVYKKTETYSTAEADGAFLKKNDNLNSVTNHALARANLGLGTMATQSTSGFSTSNHNHDSVYPKIDSNGKIAAAVLPLASSMSNGAMSIAQNDKLANIAANAEVNQNAFTTVSVNGKSLVADSKTDTLTITSGNGISITSDSITDSFSISTDGTIETKFGAQAKVDALPKTAAGIFSTFSLGSGAQVDKVVTYPEGLFTTIPSLTYSIFNADVDGAYTTAHCITTVREGTSATIRIKNKGVSTQYYIIHWQAIEIK